MHDTAMMIGEQFFLSYLGEADQTEVAILDVGGMNMNGSLRSVADRRWRYVSADLSAGDGVDVVLDDPYELPFADGTFDATISSSCFEHDALFWLTFLKMSRVTKTGGYVYLNVPSNGPFHRYPIDAWRFFPDAGLALAKWGQRCGMPMTSLRVIRRRSRT